jgi:hypothetical protein
MQRELQRPEIEAKPDWHGRNEVEAIKNPERMGCFDPQSMIYDPSSLRFSASLCDLGGESFLMSRRCGAASPYRGIEEVGGTPTLLEVRAGRPCPSCGEVAASFFPNNL